LSKPAAPLDKNHWTSVRVSYINPFFPLYSKEVMPMFGDISPNAVQQLFFEQFRILSGGRIEHQSKLRLRTYAASSDSGIVSGFLKFFKDRIGG
jgi:hypothetical protein